jgi:hypothetical protein
LNLIQFNEKEHANLLQDKWPILAILVLGRKFIKKLLVYYLDSTSHGLHIRFPFIKHGWVSYRIGDNVGASYIWVWCVILQFMCLDMLDLLNMGSTNKRLCFFPFPSL